MSSFNRGEWSEFYGVLFLLVRPEMVVVDSNLNPINQLVHIVKEVILDSKYELKYSIDERTSEIYVYANDNYIRSFSSEEIEQERARLLNAIINHVASDGAFEIPELNSFIDEMTCGVSFKAGSWHKHDLSTNSLDVISNNYVNLKYSVKSSLGSPATILNASQNTNFKYKVLNFPVELIDEINGIETRTKLLDRIAAIRGIPGVEIQFDSVVSPEFDFNLRMIDTCLPEYLANALLYSYEFNNKILKEIFCLANPFLDEHIALRKLGDFLNGISFGFVPGTKWDGLYTVNGGLIIVKNNGSVVVLDLVYFPHEVANYIINESKLDSPSTHRYHMLELFEENGEVYFTLNLQVRYRN